MRKLICAAIAAAGFSISLPVFAAYDMPTLNTLSDGTTQAAVTVYANYDFNDYTVARYGGMSIPPARWSGQRRGGRFESGVVDAEHGRSIHIENMTASDSPYVSHDNLEYFVDDTDYVFEFEWYFADFNSTRRAIFADSAGTERTIFRIKTDGSVMLETSAGAKHIATLAAGKWASFAIVYHKDTGNIDAYVNGELHKEATGVTLVSGRQSGKVKNIHFQQFGESSGVSSNSSESYLDNVKIYSGTTILPANQVGKRPAEREPDTVFDYDASYKDKINDSVAVRIGSSKAIIGSNETNLDPGNSNVKVIENNGIIMVPIRFMAEAFGAKVFYNNLDGRVTVSLNNGKEVKVGIGEDISYIDGEVMQTTQPVVEYDRVFVPLQYMMDLLDKSVHFYDDGVLVIGGANKPFDADEDKEELIDLTRHLKYTYPSKEQIKEDYYSFNGLQEGEGIAHPRLLLTQDRFDEIREKIKTDEYMQKWFETLRKTTDAYMEIEPVEYGFGADESMLGNVRESKARMENCCFMYQMTHEQKYLDRAWEEIDAVINKWDDWGFMHFLDPSEMSVGVSIAYDWLYNYWTPEQRLQMENAIRERGLNKGYEGYKGTGNTVWTKLVNNWAYVCHGAMVTSALATFDTDPDFNAQMIEYGLRGLDRSLGLFAPEGAWEESVGYWNFTIRYYVPMIDSLERYLGTEYGYFNNIEGVDQTAYFGPYMTGPTSQFNFHDAGEGFDNVSTHFWFANRLNDGNLGGYRLNMILQGNFIPDVYDMIWYQPDNYNFNAQMPLDRVYKDIVTTATFRNSWTDSGALFAGIHGGYNNANHGHLDIGTFVLDALGVRWATDLGMDNYALSNYMSNPNLYRRRAEGHNTVVIDEPGTPGASKPEWYYDQDLDGTGVIERFESKERGGYVVMDMSQSKKEKIETAKRGLYMLDGRNQVVLQDEFKLKSKGDIWWFMHTRADIEISDDGRTAILTTGGKALQAVLQSEDLSLKFTQMDAVSLTPLAMTSGQNANGGIRKLCIHGENKEKFNVSVTFTPLPIKSFEPEIPPYIPISEWSVPDGELKAGVDAEVTEIKIDGDVFEDFYPQQNVYTVNLPAGTIEVPEVTAQMEGTAEMEIIPAEDVSSSTVIVLKAPDSNTKKYYSIQFNVETLIGLPEGRKPLTIKGAEASAIPQPENPPESSYDGDLSTRWSAEGIQNIVYDLGKVEDVGAVSVAWYLGDQRSTQYGIYISSDGENWTKKFSGYSQNNSTDYNTVIFAPEEARYIKIIGYGNTSNNWNSICDCKIFPGEAQ